MYLKADLLWSVIDKYDTTHFSWAQMASQLIISNATEPIPVYVFKRQELS